MKKSLLAICPLSHQTSLEFDMGNIKNGNSHSLPFFCHYYIRYMLKRGEGENVIQKGAEILTFIINVLLRALAPFSSYFSIDS